MEPDGPGAKDPSTGNLSKQFAQPQRRREPYPPKPDEKRTEPENRTLRDDFKDAQTRTNPPATARKSEPKAVTYEHNGLSKGPKPPPGASQARKTMEYERLQRTRDNHSCRREAPSGKPINKDIGHLPHVDGPKDNHETKTLSKEFKDAQAKTPMDPPEQAGSAQEIQIGRGRGGLPARPAAVHPTSNPVQANPIRSPPGHRIQRSPSGVPRRPSQC